MGIQRQCEVSGNCVIEAAPAFQRHRDPLCRFAFTHLAVSDSVYSVFAKWYSAGSG